MRQQEECDQKACWDEKKKGRKEKGKEIIGEGLMVWGLDAFKISSLQNNS